MVLQWQCVLDVVCNHDIGSCTLYGWTWSDTGMHAWSCGCAWGIAQASHLCLPLLYVYIFGYKVCAAKLLVDLYIHCGRKHNGSCGCLMPMYVVKYHCYGGYACMRCTCVVYRLYFLCLMYTFSPPSSQIRYVTYYLLHALEVKFQFQQDGKLF